MAKHIDFTTKHPVVRMAAHCIGLDHERPYIRHGKLFYRPYRNYYGALGGNEWEQLVAEGFAERIRPRNGGKGFIYSLTRTGLDWLGEELGITIHNEED